MQTRRLSTGNTCYTDSAYHLTERGLERFPRLPAGKIGPELTIRPGAVDQQTWRSRLKNRDLFTAATQWLDHRHWQAVDLDNHAPVTTLHVSFSDMGRGIGDSNVENLLVCASATPVVWAIGGPQVS